MQDAQITAADQAPLPRQHALEDGSSGRAQETQSNPPAAAPVADRSSKTALPQTASVSLALRQPASPQTGQQVNSQPVEQPQTPQQPAVTQQTTQLQTTPATGPVAAPGPTAGPPPSSSCQLNSAKDPEVSILALAALFQTAGLQRQRSEGSDEFELRAEKVLAEAKKITQGDFFKFSIPVPSDQVKAEAGSVTIKPSGVTGGLLPTTVANGNYIIVSRHVRSAGQIRSETPFAGARTIEKDEEFILAVRARGGDYIRWPKGFKGITLPANPGLPKGSRKKTGTPELAVLFTARLQTPYLLQEVKHQSPRPDFAHDVTSQITVVVLELTCAALIDRTKNITLMPIAFGP